MNTRIQNCFNTESKFPSKQSPMTAEQILDSIMYYTVFPFLESDDFNYHSIQLGNSLSTESQVAVAAVNSHVEARLQLVNRIYLLVPENFLARFSLPQVYDFKFENVLCNAIEELLLVLVQFEDFTYQTLDEFSELIFELIYDYLGYDHILTSLILAKVEDSIFENSRSEILDIETSNKMLDFVYDLQDM